MTMPNDWRCLSLVASGAFFAKRVEGFHHSALRLIPCQRHPFGTKNAGFAQCDEIMMTLSTYKFFLDVLCDFLDEVFLRD
jgi:hypothetical protein